VIYGYTWKVRTLNQGEGYYRLTFSFDKDGPGAAELNTFIDVDIEILLSDDSAHGNQSRVGQTLGVKVYDGGTPGTSGDAIGWKWYSANNPNTPSLDNHGEWAEMCLKEIIAGNLVVHLK